LFIALYAYQVRCLFRSPLHEVYILRCELAAESASHTVNRRLARAQSFKDLEKYTRSVAPENPISGGPHIHVPSAGVAAADRRKNVAGQQGHKPWINKSQPALRPHTNANARDACFMPDLFKWRRNWARLLNDLDSGENS
jgi:hypothetical protein